MENIQIEGKTYKITELSEVALSCVKNIKHIEDQTLEKKNLIALLIKAKQGYVHELKQEMLSAKAGFDFSE